LLHHQEPQQVILFHLVEAVEELIGQELQVDHQLLQVDQVVVQMVHGQQVDQRKIMVGQEHLVKVMQGEMDHH
jgi:hypothetical protein